MGLDQAIDITAEQRKIVLALLERHLQNTTAWVYGSRAKWTARPQSDLDLVVFATPEQNGQVGELREAFEESNIPFRVDLFVWDAVPAQFRKHIKRDHVVLEEKIELGKEGDGWVSLRLGDVCTKIGSGATPRGGKEVYLEDGPCTLIRSQNVYNHRFNHGGLAFISEQQATALNNVEVFTDDVLLNITGDSVARACQVEADVLPARVNQHVAIIRPDSRKLSARFLSYFLVSPNTQTMLLSWAGSGGTRNALTKDMIESFEILAPADVDEQRAIAHILGTMDDNIELNRRMNETLEAMARALFKSWFVDFDPVRAKMAGRDTGLPKHLADLFPDRLVESELGEIPEGWEVKPLDEIAVFQNGLALQKHRPQTNEERLPVVKIAQLRSGKTDSGEWSTSNIRPECIINDGDVVFSWSGSLMVTVWCSGRAALNQHLFKVTSTRFPKWFFLHNVRFHLADFQTIAAGKATTMGHIKRHHLSDAVCTVPDGRLLAAVDGPLSAIFERSLSANIQSRILAGLRDTLLPKLISGELRVESATGPC